MTTVEFTSLADLLAPDHHKSVTAHFGLDDGFTKKLFVVSDAMTDHVNGLLDALYKTGVAHNLCECHLLKVMFGLVDEHVKPQSMNEIACATYIAGSTMAALHPVLSRTLAGGAAPKRGMSFSTNTTATA